MTSKTATIQYKPVMSLAKYNNTLAHFKMSRGFDQISHALSNIMACTGAAVIFLTSYPYTVWNRVSCQAVFSYKRPGYEASDERDGRDG